MAEQERVLVVSAHAADFCIRAGGTLSRYVAAKAPVRVLVMSPGARGESNELWRAKGGKTTEAEVAAVRHKEAEAAAAILGVEVAFFGIPDQPLTINRERLMGLVRQLRQFRPTIVLTHPRKEPYNPDHSAACLAALEAAYYATLAGVEPDLPVTSSTTSRGSMAFRVELSSQARNDIAAIHDWLRAQQTGDLFRCDVSERRRTEELGKRTRVRLCLAYGARQKRRQSRPCSGRDRRLVSSLGARAC